MRFSTIILLTLTGSLLAADSTYPLWDGRETVAAYAKRVNLPPTQSLDIGNGVNLEMVLIPAGQFIMGAAPPKPVDEHAFHQKIAAGQAVLALSGGVLLVLLGAVIVQAMRKRQRPKFSLARLLAITVTAGAAVMGGMHWRQSVRGVEAARVEFAAATARYQAAERDEKPGHSVTLTRPFYMGKFVVTQAQYQELMGQNLSDFNGSDNPMETVSWDDAQEFCNKLAERTKQTVRLPTEAEWEFACRAGTTTTYYSGDTEADLARVAWYAANSSDTIHPVGQKDPNAFGLYDMHGNIWQWCQDKYGADYYGESETENPQGPAPAKGQARVSRGGGFYIISSSCRSGYRNITVSGLQEYIGFRVVAPAP